MSYKTKISRAQFLKLYKDRTAFGQSRHEAKKTGEDRAHIYSHQTYKTYTEQAGRYYDWYHKEHRGDIPNIETLLNPEDVGKYLERYPSAWSQKTIRSALAKISPELSQVPCKPVRRQDIKKGREPGKAEGIGATWKELGEISGLRRAEFKTVQPDSLKQEGDRWKLTGIKGKGGKIRDIILTRAPSEDLRRDIERGQIQAPPKGYNEHAQRRAYALETYKRDLHERQTTGKPCTWMTLRGDRAGTKICKESALYASKQLGHNRIDVITKHYI